MDSDIIYLCYDDKPVFDRNQRLLREHHEQEERHHIQQHLSRVLEEIKEGKRKFLQTTDFPEPSDIPKAIPLERSLAVTIAYEHEDFNFNIMSQESQTGSLSPLSEVTTKPLPFEALPYQSTITHIDQICAILGKHDLEISPDLPVPAPHRRREVDMLFRVQLSFGWPPGARST